MGVSSIEVKFKLKGERPSRETFSTMADDFLIKDISTLKKLFDSSDKENKPLLRRKNLNAFVESLEIPNVYTWEKFISKYPPTHRKGKKNEFIPIAHFSDLSSLWQQRVTQAVNVSIAKISNETKALVSSKKSDLAFDIGDFLEKEAPSPKMQKFLNTTWYIYFIIIMHRTPKIGRTILRIGNTPKDVETEVYKSYGLNDYIGSVEFDNSKKFLIFNLKSKDTLERWVHIKADVNTGGLPQIILGQYQNIGIGGVSLIFSNVILQYVDASMEESATARIFEETDTDFSLVPESIKKYLYDIKLNYAETTTQIYSLDSLKRYVESYEFEERTKETYLRLDDKWNAIISTPKYSLEQSSRSKYEKPVSDLKLFLESEIGLKILDIPFRKSSGDFLINFPYEVFQQRLRHCDIFILIVFDSNAVSCLFELAWALKEGKDIIILTDGTKYLPKIFQHRPPVNIEKYPQFSTPQDAVDWLIEEADYLLKPKYLKK
jgi:hypothetical protein